MSINTSFTNDTKGIPEFWFQIFRNVYMLSELIEKHDEPVLKTLLDVKVDYFNEPMVKIQNTFYRKNKFDFIFSGFLGLHFTFYIWTKQVLLE